MRKLVVALVMCVAMVCNAQNARELGRETVQFIAGFTLGVYDELAPVVEALGIAAAESYEKRKEEHIKQFPAKCDEYEAAIAAAKVTLDQKSQVWYDAKALYDSLWDQRQEAKDAIPERNLLNGKKYNAAVSRYNELKELCSQAASKADNDVSNPVFREYCEAERNYKRLVNAYEEFLEGEKNSYGLVRM